ncbi:FG-GAP repeat domain-containing protein [Streptomyces sp. V4I2]|uniref:FG-GAP repeat domain-containing protein n=1 Tax=Streptomyces sp. V4I2 TaxID=3042280 RepID=UPI0035945E05
MGKAGQGDCFGSHSLSADLDGDGHADLIATAGSKSLFVVWGGKSGLSGAAARPTGASPVTGDFNGDGHTDLVARDAETNVGTTDAAEGAATLALGPFTARQTAQHRPVRPHPGRQARQGLLHRHPLRRRGRPRRPRRHLVARLRRRSAHPPRHRPVSGHTRRPPHRGPTP